MIHFQRFFASISCVGTPDNRSLLVVLTFSLSSLGFQGGQILGAGLCQSCNLAIPKPACPAGNACAVFADTCFLGNCGAPASVATGTCVWGPVFSSCWNYSACPSGPCVGGADQCSCAAPAGLGC